MPRQSAGQARLSRVAITPGNKVRPDSFKRRCGSLPSPTPQWSHDNSPGRRARGIAQPSRLQLIRLIGRQLTVGHCCVGRSRTAGDWSGDCTSHELGLRWFPVRYGLSCRDVEELLAGRGITVDHVTGCRWVQRFTPELIEAARPGRHAPGARWFAGETYLKVAGKWAYLCRAAGQHGQVIDVLPAARRDLAAARHFFTRGRCAPGRSRPTVSADRAHVYPQVPGELIPAARHTAGQHANNPGEADHGRPESPAPADARAKASPLSSDPRRRSRLRAEPAPRPLRHRHRRLRPPPAPYRLR